MQAADNNNKPRQHASTSLRYTQSRRIGLRVRELAMAAGLAVAGSAAAAPDAGWAPPQALQVGEIGEVASHTRLLNDYGADGTAWVAFLEGRIDGQFVKSEHLYIRYKRPGDTQWGVQVQTPAFFGMRLVCDAAAFAALGDGRALYAYRVHTNADGSTCTSTGIQLLLIDPDLAHPVETFFRSGLTNNSPENCRRATGPRIATHGSTALVTWYCIPEVGGTSALWVESAYFDGVNWSGPVTVPGVNRVYKIVSNANGEFRALGEQLISESPVRERLHMNVFSPTTANWAAQPELVHEAQRGSGSSNRLSAADIAIADDDSTLVAYMGEGIHARVRHRDAMGNWGESQTLIVPDTISEWAAAQLLRISAAGTRYAAIWPFYRPSNVEEEQFGAGVAIRAADGTWTTPIDLGLRALPLALARGRMIGFPNGSFTAFVAIPAVMQGLTGALYTATAPGDSNCWRATVDMQEEVDIQYQVAAGPGGDFIATWLVREGPDGQQRPKAVIAAGPDGTGGSDDCQVATPPEPGDTTPDAFSFTAITNAALGSVVESSNIVVQGIDTATPISISGGEYSVNGGGFTSASGSVNNGNSVRVRLTASASNATTSSTTLNIGGVSGIFSVTTLAAVDTTPDAFSFTAITNAALGSVVESSNIVVQGIDTATPISISGGEYSVNGGGFTSASGSVNNGNSVRVRLTASASNATTSSTTLNIGGVSGIFSVTTLAATVNPEPPSNGGGGGSLDWLSLLLLIGIAGLALPGRARRIGLMGWSTRTLAPREPLA